MSEVAARRLRIGGHVQGVGFRPFVYRLAQELELSGTVQNLKGEVEILVQGRPGDLERFCRELTKRAPPLARPEVTASLPAERSEALGFRILESLAAGDARVFVPPDCFVCEECLAELADPHDRRYRYPFINCTQCGPRYTLIEALPYDRARTTMARFVLCRDCLREYEDPRDRRFHAEPVACPACGPTVWLRDGETRCDGQRALARAGELLRSGAIVAVKGVGGYHLLCAATDQAAVERLRWRKRRPHKPLAVMFPQSGADGLDAVRAHVLLDAGESELLRSPARPIVLLRRRQDSRLAPAIAPGLAEVGVLLPYSPLHHLLLGDLGQPVVATSGNISGEPVLTDPEAAESAFASIADACLHHDRPIARPADDPVMRVSHGRARTLRLGRGVAPLELPLGAGPRRPLLAVGGHLKTTVALAWDERVVLSPHIADMGTVRSEQVFVQVVQDLQRLYGVSAEQVVCDAHPGYATSRWATHQGLPVMSVLHHHAHASALAGEHGLERPLLVFAWDGIGLGADRTLWGGETFLGMPGRWERVASFRPFHLPGGELSGRSPWRSAAALCWELGLMPSDIVVDPLVRRAWESRINSPQTSSAGRLFDGAAALALGVHEVTHEGQAAMLLEAAAGRALEEAACGQEPDTAWGGLPGQEESSGLRRLDWSPLVKGLLDVRASPAARALRFHVSLAETIVAVSLQQRRRSGIRRVGLTGGCFQNALLTRLAHERLVHEGFDVCLAQRVPCNDGGLAYGQIIEAIALQRRGQEIATSARDG
jgi:hydrogenase maturation protein HypF